MAPLTYCVFYFFSFSLFPRRPVFSFLWFGSLHKNAATLWICSSSAREAPGDEGRNECLSGKPDSVAFPTVAWKMGSRQSSEERFIRINFQKPINYAYALPNYLSELVLEDGSLRWTQLFLLSLDFVLDCCNYHFAHVEVAIDSLTISAFGDPLG